MERRKGSKVLIPKCFIVSDYWKKDNTYEDDSKIINEIKMFERLKIVLLNNNVPINASDPIQKSDESKLNKGSKLEASPSASKSKNQKSNTQTQIPQSPNSTPSIIKFISKMSKKDVICKLEPIHGSNPNSTAPVSPAPCKKPTNFATPVTPNSPKISATGSTAEKRGFFF